MIKAWTEEIRKDPKGVEFRYIDRIMSVRCDSTGGSGDAPVEMLQQHSGLVIGPESFVVFTDKSKNDMYSRLDECLFKEPGDPSRFSYPSDHPLAGEFEEQMTTLIREYVNQKEYLSPHHPEVAGAHDDAPDSVALAMMGAVTSKVGEIVFV